jgi:putative alpha-1,2-mannosidase
MIGDHCAVLLGDAFQKGLLNDEKFDVIERAYNAMRRNALEVPSAKEYLMGKGRRAIKEYLNLGFVPLEATMPLTFHDKEQVSRTMEYAYEWLTEATAYQYAWYVPHQIEKLIDIYGGGEPFADKLNTFFDMGYYNHGNEPDHQAVFLYAYLRDVPEEGAWRIQNRVKSITSAFYTDGPGGLAGNDDAGQISSWYVLSAMGFYQVCPGCGGFSEYVLTTPLFDSTVLKLGNNDFVITAEKSSNEDIYIQSALLNEITFDCAFLPHDVIVKGGSLILQLGSTPNKTWGSHGRDCLEFYFA